MFVLQYIVFVRFFFELTRLINSLRLISKLAMFYKNYKFCLIHIAESINLKRTS